MPVSFFESYLAEGSVGAISYATSDVPIEIVPENTRGIFVDAQIRCNVDCIVLYHGSPPVFP